MPTTEDLEQLQTVKQQLQDDVDLLQGLAVVAQQALENAEADLDDVCLTIEDCEQSLAPEGAVSAARQRRNNSSDQRIRLVIEQLHEYKNQCIRDRVSRARKGLSFTYS